MVSKIEQFFERMVGDIWNFTIAKVDNNVITLGTITTGIILLALGIWLSKFLSRRFTKRLLRKTTLDISVQHTLESITFYILAIIFVLFAMRMANLPISIFTVVGGALAIGVGFGSQNIVNNFISGVILMMERPIKVGDYIEVDGSFGFVQDIGMRSTVIQSNGNRHIVVPNSSFLEKSVLNWTHQSDSLVRLSVSVGVAYGSDTELVKRLLIQAASDDPRCLKNPQPIVLFTEFGDSALNFEILFWVRLTNIMDQPLISSNIRFKIDELFRSHNVQIPFPQRDLHIVSNSAGTLS